MRILRNKVAVIPDQDINEVDGFNVDAMVDDHERFSSTGIVSAVPDRLQFHHVQDWLTHKTQFNVWMSRILSADGLEYMPTRRLEVGERVLYNYNQRFSANYPIVNGQVIMSYDQVYAVWRDGWKAMNGWVLLEMMEGNGEEEIAPGVFFKHSDRNKYGHARVISCSPFALYRDARLPKLRKIPAGATVLYDKKYTARVELDAYNTLTNRQSSLFRIQLKNILWSSSSR
jgi:co-chaperonin GroES (HSP10)